MKHLRNGKPTDPADPAHEPDWAAICANWGDRVSDIFERMHGEADSERHAGMVALEFDLQLDGIDREFLREVGIEA